MRKYVILLLCAVVCSMSRAENLNAPEMLARHVGNGSISGASDCDTVIAVNGYDVRVVKNNGAISHIGLNLFSEDMKRSVDRELLGYMEEALLAKSLGISDEPFDKLVITSGTIADFKKLGPDSSCSVNSMNSKSMSASWDLGGKTVSVTIPVGYDTNSKGSRTDIEEDFITKLRSYNGSRAKFETIEAGRLEPYSANISVYPGAAYHSRLITRDVYFSDNGTDPVWDAASPKESIANLFLYPSEKYGNTKINISILRHEYGEKNEVSVALDQFLAMCESDGCVPFWGVEKFENGVLEGALFLYNKRKGYDHTLKIVCKPEDVINGKGDIRARASLFIPTNNVHELFAPYVKKTEKEKIKYVK